MPFGLEKKKDEEKRKNFAPVIKELQEKFAKSNSEVSTANKSNPMAGYLQDLEASKTSRHRSLKRFFTKQDSKEYTDVKDALRGVVEDTQGSFGSDAKANSDMLNSAVNNYHKLIAACNIYLNKDGGNKGTGKERKDKVRQILELAMMDYESVKTLSYRVRSMSVEEQSKLNWQEILQEARTMTLEVDDLSNFQSIGAAMKTGESAGRLIPGHGIFTKEQKLNVSDMVDELQTRDNFISVSYNEGSEENFNPATVGETFNQTNRNVATSRVANLLGIGGIVEQSSTVKIREKGSGQVTKGNLMTLAKGDQGGAVAGGKIYEGMRRMDNIQERMNWAGKLFAPTVQKELCSLQVLDYICGQTDRHANNFFLEKDSSGSYAHVHGIDNDMSFGTGVDLGKLVAKTGDHERKRSMRMVVDAEGNLAIPHMDRQLAMNIKSLTPDELRFALEDIIEPVFIEAAIARLKIVQDAIQREEGKTGSKVFVDNDSGWGKATHEALIESTGNMRMKYAEAAAGGYDQFFESSGYIDDKKEKYEMFRQNGYYGEFMLSLMGYNFHDRKFESD